MWLMPEEPVMWQVIALIWFVIDNHALHHTHNSSNYANADRINLRVTLPVANELEFQRFGEDIGEYGRLLTSLN